MSQTQLTVLAAGAWIALLALGWLVTGSVSGGLLAVIAVALVAVLVRAARSRSAR
jgi:hypothetical protein